MSKNEKNGLDVQAETVAETTIAVAMQFTVEQSFTVDHIDEQEQALKEQVAKVMKARGLVSTRPAIAMLSPLHSWREQVRNRLNAIIACHRPGASVIVKTDDIEVNEEKAVRSGNRKTVVKVAKEDAIARLVSEFMSDCKDTTEKQEDGSLKVVPAKDMVDFTIKAPSNRKPQLIINFDMNK